MQVVALLVWGLLPVHGAAGEELRNNADFPKTVVGGHANLRAIAQFRPPPEKLKLPLAWVHIPRCGSSFANTLIHAPGVCRGLPEDAAIPLEPSPLNAFFKRDFPKMDYCEGGFLKKDVYPDPPGHTSVGPIFDLLERERNGVIMLRQPEQRILSSFHFHHIGFEPEPVDMSEKEYARYAQGCMVKMLVYDNHLKKFGAKEGPCLNTTHPAPPTHDQIQLAKHRLRSGFQFVGITERWQESVCLWHAMFGGKCKDFMFGDIRRGPDRRPSKGMTQHDVAPLEGFTDTGDRELYAEAQKIFQRRLDKYGISESTCPSLCE